MQEFICFEDMFERATGHRPYPYQSMMGRMKSWPRIIDVPTGAGKTASAVLGWLWRRRYHSSNEVITSTPRRLVYCLPARVLVEQVRDCVQSWLENLCLDEGPEKIQVHVLMGGESETDWATYPEQEAILIGTQDMLLSRSLNRGYGASRYRWPREFGLLNNDVLWIYDEVQLMGAGLPTSAQLDGLRVKLGAFGPIQSTWMSATLQSDWLNTVDFRPVSPQEILTLSSQDSRAIGLEAVLNAQKRLHLWDGAVLTDKAYPSALAAFTLEEHQKSFSAAAEKSTMPPLTLVILNTVRRAQEVYSEILRLVNSHKNARTEVLLIHSRFRPPDREKLVRALLSPTPDCGRIVVATQAIEAGVDISAQTLVTELAPWASMVQRFGRCNRRGEYEVGNVWWIDNLAASKKDQGKWAIPYALGELVASREVLQSLDTVGFGEIGSVKMSIGGDEPYVLRRRDLLDLFDTTPDLSGNDIDISRFVRESPERDLQVFWRTWDGSSDGAPPPDSLTAPTRDELCHAPVKDVENFIRKASQRSKLPVVAWSWDYLSEKWSPANGDKIRPGMIFLLNPKAGGYLWRGPGGYSLGWWPDAEDTVDEHAGVNSGGGSELEIPNHATPEEGMGSERYAYSRRWITVAEHSDAVVTEAKELLRKLKKGLVCEIDDETEAVLVTAARWHDAGKTHPVFVKAINEAARKAGFEWKRQPLAKAATKMGPYERRYFRHELASALRFQHAQRRQPSRDDGLERRYRLIAYLIAAHHGKVRVVLGAMPGEELPPSSFQVQDSSQSGIRYALGLCDGDIVPDISLGTVDLGGGVEICPQEINLAPMELGSADGCVSWTESVLALRDSNEIGPFRLAYLEALLRAADIRASLADACENAERPWTSGGGCDD